MSSSTTVPKQIGNVTSFRKKGAESLNIRGTRIAAQNAQLLTSTGSSTLDFFIGGGLSVGTVCLIEEDRFNTYSKVLLKYFLSEGIANGHSIFLSSGGESSKQILSKLPSIRVPEVKCDSAGENLKIAWRYQSQPAASASGIRTASQNHGYDLSKTLAEDVVQGCQIATWDPQNDPPSTLLERLHSEIGPFQTGGGCHNILRVAVSSLGSPLFGDCDILRFLHQLKAILRKSFAVAMVTVPSYLTQNKVLINRIRQTCDTVIGLESFVGSNKASNPLFKELDGLLQVSKLPVLNTFTYPTLAEDLAFKLRRKDFTIERLHLPPDLEDGQTDPNALGGCGGGQPSKLDF